MKELKKPDYQRLYDRTQGRMDILIEVAEATVQTHEKSAQELRQLIERIKRVQKSDIERYEIEEYDCFNEGLLNS